MELCGFSEPVLEVVLKLFSINLCSNLVNQLKIIGWPNCNGNSMQPTKRE